MIWISWAECLIQKMYQFMANQAEIFHNLLKSATFCCIVIYEKPLWHLLKSFFRDVCDVFFLHELHKASPGMDAKLAFCSLFKRTRSQLSHFCSESDRTCIKASWPLCQSCNVTSVTVTATEGFNRTNRETQHSFGALDIIIWQNDINCSDGSDYQSNVSPKQHDKLKTNPRNA